MEVSAKARYIRMSPRKVRLVVDVVRGMDLVEAQDQLGFMNKAAALPVLKLINSAAANAEHNFKLKSENLFVKTIKADGGPTLKRFKPRARGRAAPIRKRTTHITVVLDEKEKAEKKSEVKKENKESTIKKATKKVEKKEVKKKAKSTSKSTK
jgi:large subunit ribosomal protein L22